MTWTYLLGDTRLGSEMQRGRVTCQRHTATYRWNQNYNSDVLVLGECSFTLLSLKRRNSWLLKHWLYMSFPLPAPPRVKAPFMTWKLTGQASLAQTTWISLVQIIITLVCAGVVSLSLEKKIKDHKKYFFAELIITIWANSICWCSMAAIQAFVNLIFPTLSLTAWARSIWCF